ncbi:hypothetical protein ACFL4S_01430, partial [bacterium]
MPEQLIKIGLSINTNKLVVKTTGKYDIYSNKKVKGSLEQNKEYICGIYKGKRVVISKLKVFDRII